MENIITSPHAHQPQTHFLALEKSSNVLCHSAVQGHSRVLPALLPYFPSISQGFEDFCSLLCVAVTLPSVHTLLGGFAAGGWAGKIGFLSLPPAHPMDRRGAAPPKEDGPGPLLILKKGISFKLKSFPEPSAPFSAFQHCPQHSIFTAAVPSSGWLMSPIIKASGLPLPPIQLCHHRPLQDLLSMLLPLCSKVLSAFQAKQNRFRSADIQQS